MERNKKHKDNQQKTQLNFLAKKTPIAPLGSARDKGESTSNFLKKTDERLKNLYFCFLLFFSQLSFINPIPQKPSRAVC